LARDRKDISPIAQGVFVLTGATLIDGTGRPPARESVVVVRDGKIVRAGPRAETPIPSGAKVLNVAGTTIAPGLWDMHAHAANIEWLDAYMGAGVTTIRDMGGEQPYLTAVRDSIASRRGL